MAEHFLGKYNKGLILDHTTIDELDALLLKGCL